MIHPFTQTASTMRTYVALAFVLAFWLPSFVVSTGLAQEGTAITPTIGVGGLGTTVMADGNIIQITGGTRPDGGTNLFHSFDQFSVGRPDTAQFLNTTPSLHTSNILGRVTGGNPSSIFGTIDTMSYPEANLFLINPAGIVFGPNSTLNVGGSVAFTTADYLRLAEANGSHAGIFHADTTSTSVLTSASVAAFGFLGSNPSAIAVQGSTLEMQPGQSISLVGGNQGFKNPGAGSTSVPNGVTVTGGKLLAQSGRVNIASVASPGEILAGSLDQAPNINGQSFGALGTIQILQQSAIDTSGEGGGTVLIRGGRLVVDASTISANTGDISLDATSIDIKNFAEIVTGTETAANAGHITLKASGNIDTDFTRVESISENSSGHAGNITFSSSQGDVSLTKTIVTSQTSNSSGNAGNITINAPRGNILLAGTEVFNAVGTDGTGTLGGIQIKAHDLDLRGGTLMGGDNFAKQVAGNIVIMLDGRLTLSEGSAIETGALGSADAADLIVSAPDILITGKESSLFTGTISSGDGGQLRLFTDNLQLVDGGTLSSKSFIGSEGEIPSGSGGVISIQGLRSPDTSVTIDGPGTGIFTDTKGTGLGGAIDLSTLSLTIENGGAISAETSGTAPSATGGSIIVNTTDHVIMTSGASITASSTVPATRVISRSTRDSSSRCATARSRPKPSRPAEAISTSVRSIACVWSTARSARRSRVALRQPAAISQSIRMSWSCKTAKSSRKRSRALEEISRSRLLYS
jgi:filamentous hemagglutinin family protein